MCYKVLWADEQIERRTDGQTDVQTDGRTEVLTERDLLSIFYVRKSSQQSNKLPRSALLTYGINLKFYCPHNMLKRFMRIFYYKLKINC